MTPLEQEVLLGLLDSFLDDSLILEVLEVVKGGKEATVFRCAAAPSTGQRFFAAKVYRPMERRSFRNDTTYQGGRVILNHRTRRAYEKGTEFGREAQQGLWVNAEYETQRTLYELGADVPRPWKCNGSAILMEWLGTDADAAVQLRHARLNGHGEAHRLHERLLANIELMLRNNVVHGDLSPFNVLYVEDDGGAPGVRIIDFPQSVDARTNRKACDLLHRDVENVCRYFEKYGVHSDPYRIASRWWKRFVYAEL
jgi:RIO kinase 1